MAIKPTKPDRDLNRSCPPPIQDLLLQQVLEALLALQAKLGAALRALDALADHVQRASPARAHWDRECAETIRRPRPSPIAASAAAAPKSSMSRPRRRRLRNVRPRRPIFRDRRPRATAPARCRRCAPVEDPDHRPTAAPVDGGNDKGRAALRALALHAHVRFIALQQVPLRAKKLKCHSDTRAAMVLGRWGRAVSIEQRVSFSPSYRAAVALAKQ